MSDPTEIGAWLMAKVRENGARRTYQSQAVRQIVEKFGAEWSYKNHNGNPAIDRRVLTEFGKLKDEFVIWDRSDQSWRIVDQAWLDRERERLERRRVAAEQRQRQREEREAS